MKMLSFVAVNVDEMSENDHFWMHSKCDCTIEMRCLKGDFWFGMIIADCLLGQNSIMRCVRYLSGGRSELPWQLNALTEIVAFSEPTSRLMRRVGCQWKYGHTLNSVCLTLEWCLESNHSFCHCRLSMWVTGSSSLRIRVGLGCRIHCSGSCFGLFWLKLHCIKLDKSISRTEKNRLSGAIHSSPTETRRNFLFNSHRQLSSQLKASSFDEMWMHHSSHTSTPLTQR